MDDASHLGVPSKNPPSGNRSSTKGLAMTIDSGNTKSTWRDVLMFLLNGAAGLHMLCAVCVCPCVHIDLRVQQQVVSPMYVSEQL